MQSKVAIDLQKYAQRFQVAINSDRFAVEMDRMDPLAEFRSRFTFPTMKTLPCSKLFFFLKGSLSNLSLQATGIV